MPEPITISYQTPGRGWKVRTLRTEEALAKFVDSLDSDVEVRYYLREADK